MLTVAQAFALALQHHQAGRLAEAEALYQQILAVQPKHADAWHFLGVIAHQAGRHEQAVATIQQALALAPSLAIAHGNLGEAQRALGRLDEAMASYRRAIELRADYPEAYNNLGNALRHLGRFGEAIAAYHRAIELRPEYPEACNNLGNALRDQGRFGEAMAAYHRALDLWPESAELHHNLSIALREQGRLEEAGAASRCALRLKPDFAEAHFNLGHTLWAQGQLDAAIAACRRALELQPNYPEALNGLALALDGKGELDEAIVASQRALELQPDYADAWNNLGHTLKDQGSVREAIAAFQRAIQCQPGHAAAHSNLLYALQFDPGHDDRSIAAEHQLWNRQFAEPLRPFLQPHSNDRNPDKRLRIGYVSPDFYFQAEAFFVVPLLEAHDHRQFEIHCYASVRRPDAVTERLRRSVDAWHDVRGLSEADLAQQIRTDGIDILIDLTMHMRDNRLLVFARKPAPVQVAWLAYPGSTGLPTMDYRLTDGYLDAPEAEAPYYAEKSVWLPDCWCCYHPLTDEPPVGALPVIKTGTLTFGCLNNFCKMNPPTLERYGKILQAVESSRLLLLAPEGSARQRILDQWQAQGISRDRIEFVRMLPREDYLKLYHRIDIALDALPYNGITTTCDALWMGVPVVTLAGKTAAGRAGLGLLSAVGLSELATKTPDEFTEVAKKLASDVPRLAELRRTLRTRMEGSVLMDAPRFARNIEAVYRAMWRRWCGAQ